MLNKLNINDNKKKLLVYIVLTVATLAVYLQVNKFDFINFDDDRYVTANSHIQSVITMDGLRWALTTTHAEFWHPLTWLSLMFDYQFYGLNPGGYHLTNLILHILSALLLFWFFNRCTGAVWRSGFVAALFALHPFHVESVAWIAERKDVLSAFFWMLTLCLYVYYAEKTGARRYLLVLFSFACALMSKSMAVTLPAVMILLDYWPLNRFESHKNRLILWQLKEKIPLLLLSIIFSIITFFLQYNQSVERLSFPLTSRLANASVAFMTYLGKTLWPYDMSVFYPYVNEIPLGLVLGTTFLILAISTAVVVMIKRMPYLFVGWLWYMITILPVIGILQVRSFAIADRYHYLPSIGIAIMLAWGIPSLIKRENIRRNILFPAAIAVLFIFAVLTFKQCGYWKNTFELFSHNLEVTKDNPLAQAHVGECLYNKGQFEKAIYHYSEAIRLKPAYANFYYLRGIAYAREGRYKEAVNDFNQVTFLDPDYINAYNNRAFIYDQSGNYEKAIENINEIIRRQPGNPVAYYNRGFMYIKLGRYQPAINDFNNAIARKQDYTDAFHNRSMAYFKQNMYKMGCSDAQKSCDLGNCQSLKWARGNGYCR